MKKHIWSLGVILLLIALFKGCQGNREFKGNGIIELVNDNEVTINTLVPDPLRKNTNECSVVSIGEQLKCQESKEGLVYTHSINVRDIKTKKEDLRVGNVVSLRLPKLNYHSLQINRQHLRMTRYETLPNTPVFMTGEYQGKELMVKKVFKAEGIPLTLKSDSPVGFIKVCVLPNNGDHTFLMRREEAGGIHEYELMFPGVREDLVGAGEALNKEPNQSKVLTFNPTMTSVIGMGSMSSFNDCINPSSVVVPTYKSERLVSKGLNEVQTVHTPNKKTDWALVGTLIMGVPTTFLLSIYLWG